MSKQTLQAILKNYQKSVRDARAKILEARKIYQPEEAKEREEKLLEHLEHERSNAMSAIQEEREKACQGVAKWGQLDGSKITADAKLLEHGLVTPDQFSQLVEKYQDNGTMCALLRNYAEQHNEQLRAKSKDAFPAGILDTRTIPTQEDMTRAAEHDAKSALSIVGMIDGGFLGGPDSAMVQAAIDNFLD